MSRPLSGLSPRVGGVERDAHEELFQAADDAPAPDQLEQLVGESEITERRTVGLSLRVAQCA